MIAALGIDNSFNHILLKMGFQWCSGQKDVADILSPSIYKQVWIGTLIIKFFIIKKRNIYKRVGVTSSTNLTRDDEPKMHFIESYQKMHAYREKLFD